MNLSSLFDYARLSDPDLHATHVIAASLTIEGVPGVFLGNLDIQAGSRPRFASVLMDRLSGELVRYYGTDMGHLIFQYATVSVSRPMGVRRSFRFVMPAASDFAEIRADVANAIETVADGRVVLRGRSDGDPSAPELVLRLAPSIYDTQPIIR